MSVAGYSLGGYLAQRAAADNADLVGNGEVVTFQSGGLHREDTAKFNEANADGHIDVRHHQTNMDVVHRAGEAPLPGTARCGRSSATRTCMMSPPTWPH